MEPADRHMPLNRGEPMDMLAWERDLDRIVGKRTASNGRIEFLIDGDEFFPRLRRSIANANEEIHVRTYIFDNDDVALNFA